MEEKKKRLSAEKRKDMILNAACNLFAEKGYENTSTKQLAMAANCSEALLYKYFDSKQAIMDTLLQEWANSQNRKIKLEIIDNSALLTLRKHYETFVSLSKNNSAHTYVRDNLIKALNSTPYYRQKAWDVYIEGSDMIRETIVPMICLGQEQGEIKKGDPTVMANIFVGYMVGAREICSNFTDRFSPVSFDTLIDIIFH